MSVEFTDRALVLHVGTFRETDMWVRVLTPSRGVLTGFAFGGCRSTRRFCGCLDPLNQVLFRFKSNRAGTYLSLEEGTLQRAPGRVRQDPNRLGLAVNCLKFLEASEIGSDGAQDAFDLFAECLHVLDAPAEPSMQLPVLFRARLAAIQGYAPAMDRCAGCGCEVAYLEEARLLVPHGGVLCPRCMARMDVPDAAQTLRMSGRSLDTLRHICAHGPDVWRSLPLEGRVARECARAIDCFVQYHMGLSWDRNRFRRV